MKVKVSWFGVDDFESAKKFYGQVLGLKKTFEAQQWAEYRGRRGGRDHRNRGESARGQRAGSDRGAGRE